MDASNDQKRAMGRWQNDSMEGSYLSYIPVQGMMNWAGFKSKESYFIVRDSPEPPDELMKLVFPTLEAAEQRYLSVPVSERHISGQAFINLLKWLRRVILQDAVLLQAAHPEHRIFKHPMFTSDLFRTFQSNANEIMESTVEPANMQIDQVLPGVMSAIQGLTDLVGINGTKGTQERRALSNEIQKNLQFLTVAAQETTRNLEPIMKFVTTGGGFSIQFTPEKSDKDKSSESVPTSSCLDEDLQESPPSPIRNGNTDSVLQNPVQTLTSLPPTPAVSGQKPKNHSTVPQYRFNRSAETVRALFEEYLFGHNGARPVRDLEKELGGKYRALDSEKTWFKRRKCIFHAMETMLRAGYGHEEIIRRLDTVFESLNSKSLHQLNKRLTGEPLRI